MDIRKLFIFGVALAMVSAGVRAQDTTKRRTIDITSSFKPVLRDAVKINFNAAPPVVDTSRPHLSYSIPAQYLFLTYLPAEMKPVALQADTANPWQNDNYIKIGAGNVHLPYVKAGFSFSDGKTRFLNIFADQLSSKGNLPDQKNSLTNVRFVGTLITPANLEWNAGIGFKNDNYNLYGYQPVSLKFPQDSLQQQFQAFEGSLSMRNRTPTEFGIVYHPNLKVSVFTDNHTPGASEENTVLNLPLEKSFGQRFAFDLGFTANLTNYRQASIQTIQNNLFYVSPAFVLKTPNLFLQASVVPSWDNKAFTLLPNFMADISTSDKRFGIQLGWIGYYDKGSYQRFESINPWLAQPTLLLNTRMQERYAGFKGSLDNHFSYSAKIGFLEYKNMPLFVNDTLGGGRKFVIRYEPSMEALQFHGEVSYIVGEAFSAVASLNWNQYTHLQTEAKAWGLLPLEFNTALRWEAFKDFWAKIDLFAFDGAQYRAANGESFKGDGAFDMNAGVELRVARQVNLWLQLNNLFNDKYERWHQYQVYGFNLLVGVVFSFGQK